MGVKGKSGRKPTRFCRLGHDKSLPRGGYIRSKPDRPNPALICAVCERDGRIRRMQIKHLKELKGE